MKVAVVVSFLLIHVSQCARIRRQVVVGDKCTTPLGHPGECRDIQTCPVLLDLAKQSHLNPSAFAVLRDSRCGPNPKACCPDMSTPASTTTLPMPTTQKPSETNSSSSSSCGKSSYNTDQIIGLSIDTRIAGGQPAPLGGWPWVVALGYESWSRTVLEWLCGGSLVSESHVLTAAHCVASPPVSRSMKLSVVRLGDLDLDGSVDDRASPVDMQVESTVYHPRYKYSTHDPFVNDIAIVKMKGRVQFTSLIQPICLPNTQLGSPVGRTHYVAGWGTLRNDERSSTTLQEVDVIVTSEESCRKILQGNEKAVIDERVICAGNPGKDACRGDSGGPLMYEKEDTYYLIGVVSFGIPCNIGGYPGVYTRVSSFLDWIFSNLN